MRTSLHVIRGGPLLAMLVLLAGIPSAHAGSKPSASIHGPRQSGSGCDRQDHREPVATRECAAVRAFAGCRLAVRRGLVVMAKLAESPLGCASDHIFTNGFEPGV